MKRIAYAKLPTEQSNPRFRNIDILSIEKTFDLINQEDRSVPVAVNKAKKQITQAVRIITNCLKQGGRLFFTGAGTSGRLGVIEASECPPTFGTPPSLVQSVIAGGKRAVFRSKEGAEDQENEGYRLLHAKLKSKDVLVGIAASGVTPFVQGALRAAKQHKAKRILVTCNPTFRDKKIADVMIRVSTGPEIITGSTRLKAGTATKLVLNMLTVIPMIQLGKVYQNWMVDVQPKSNKLRARALRLVQNLGQVSESDAVKFLQCSKNKVKAAILMARTGIDYSQAMKRLQKAKGFLKIALNQKSIVSDTKVSDTQGIA